MLSVLFHYSVYAKDLSFRFNVEVAHLEKARELAKTVADFSFNAETNKHAKGKESLQRGAFTRDGPGPH